MDNQKGNFYLIITIIVGVFAIGVIGFASWKYFGEVSDLEKNGNKIIKSTIEKETEKSEAIGEISDWKTYQNEKYGYEIKYPLDWIIETYDGKYGEEVKKPQEKAGWISLAFHTKDKQKIKGHQESLMASVNIHVINKPLDFTVEDYLRDFGYDMNSETLKERRVLLTRGIAEVWMNIKEENFKGHKAYVIETMKELGYDLYFKHNQNIYKITSLYKKNEISREEILEIINTFNFQP